jgi:alkylation response protein AidB-like acyl-CoA dehydrogenase
VADPGSSHEFEFSAEQLSLREMAGKVVSPSRSWTELGALGLIGLAVPESLGGGGAGVIELQIVAEALGWALARTPFLATAGLGTSALMRSGDETIQRELLPEVCLGRTTLAVVATGARGAWLPSRLDVAATATADGWALNGCAGHVLDGADATTLLVLAETGTSQALFLVEGRGDGVSRTELSVLDPTRPQAAVEFSGAPARLIGDLEAGRKTIEAASDRAAAVLAAEQLGVAEHMLALSVDYAKTRLQFGRAIGSFQAVKHQCADMLVSVEHARSAAYHAGWALDADVDDVRIASSLAHVVCSQSAAEVTARAIQVHGGIGFTWEHAAHRYFKRSSVDRQLLGGTAAHLERLAELVIDRS